MKDKKKPKKDKEKKEEMRRKRKVANVLVKQFQNWFQKNMVV